MRLGFLLISILLIPSLFARHALVLQSDFGTRDGAVASMKGVAVSVDQGLPIFDLSHDNTPFDIWEASYRLKQAVSYWPKGTVFVSVIDPGVGTARASVVLETKSGQFIVTPDNGTLTHVAEDLGIEAVREIDETLNRLEGSGKSYTFHGRDVYAYTGARLAAGVIDFDEVGPLLEPEVMVFPHTPARIEDGAIVGGIPVLDYQYGNVWTNIPAETFEQLEAPRGSLLIVTVTRKSEVIYKDILPYVFTFGEVPEGEPLLYLNDLLHVAIALNQGNFAKAFSIQSGGDWQVRITRAE